ncbi:hypothetical protein ACLESD_32085 [Pyxidicoccus sp. 3LFB2]
MRLTVVRKLLGWGWLVTAALGGCTHGHNTVTGHITELHFKFKTVTAVSRKAPSGWRAVCIHARMTQGDSGATTVCKFEVGLPVRNQEQGDISLERAQQMAATLANQSAHTVLSRAHPGEMLAVLCLDFKEEYERALGEQIHGSRVSDCVTKGIETVHFDIAPEAVP